MDLNLHIIPTDLLERYREEVGDDVQVAFEQLQDSELSVDTFSFYTSVSAVFSSKIEGEDIELDSYVKHKRMGAHFLPDYTRKTDDLYDTYVYAQGHELTKATVLYAHAMITRHILHKDVQGKVRTGNMFVLTDDGRIEYVAAAPDMVKRAMEQLCSDIAVLLETALQFNEVLYFAAMIHLVFVKIHPFEDGNGRTGRLLEKWFLAQKLGVKAWFVQSERNYYTNHQAYYNNIRKLGLEYDALNYGQAMPFLLMLPQSIRTVKQ